MKFSQFDNIGLEKINERADVIKNNPEFIERCKKAIIEKTMKNQNYLMRIL